MNERRIFPFILVIPGLIAIFKALSLQQHIGSREPLYLNLIRGDAQILTLFVIFFILLAFVRSTFTRKVLLAVSGLTALFYLLDTLALLNFNSHLTPEYVLEYLPEWKALLTFVRWWHFPALLLFAVSWGRSIRAVHKPAQLFLTVPVLYFLSSFLPVRAQSSLIDQFALKLLPKRSVRPISGELRYPISAELRALSQQGDRPRAALPAGVKNIILVMIESFSAVHSHRVSGLDDFMPEFDRISHEGTLFTNFFANYANTEGGMVAILSGALPISYPSAANGLYESFAFLPSVLDPIAALGMRTYFLAATPLIFRDKNKYLKNIGFVRVEGRDEINLLKAAPRFTFDSPADDMLYQASLKKINALKQNGAPYFLTIETGTGHLPYIDPQGRDNSPRNIWRFIDREFSLFYQELRQLNFFDDGLLIVLGDHRHMLPMTEREHERYGASARARVPLLVIGAGVIKERIDPRFFQESDLFPLLDSAVKGDSKPLSPYPVFVEHYSFNYTSPQTRTRFEVYPESEKGMAAWSGFVEGGNLVWDDHAGSDRSSVTAAIHQQRALHQYVNGGKKKGCSLLWPSTPLPAISSTNGVAMEQYSGLQISGELNRSSPRFINTRIVPNINFPELLSEQGLPPAPFALRFEAFLKVEEPGVYWFRVESDDGACLSIDRQLVINSEAVHQFSPDDGAVWLSGGFHKIGLRYYQRDGNAGVRLSWSRGEQNGWDWQLIPETSLFLAEHAGP